MVLLALLEKAEIQNKLENPFYARYLERVLDSPWCRGC